MNTELSTPGEVLAEIARLHKMYNYMVAPRDVDGVLLKDNDMVEIISLGAYDLANCNVLDQATVYLLIDGLRLIFIDTSFVNLDYRSASCLRLISK